MPILQGHFGRQCPTDAELADGRARIRLAAPTPLAIARNLAGWGAKIEVIVQAELARIGAELTTRYTSGHGPTGEPNGDEPDQPIHNS